MITTKIFESTHKLYFEVASYPLNCDTNNNWLRFRVGTCNGLWCSTATSFDILAITNDKPGNGHFIDVLEWFEQSCIRERKNLRILEIWNENFKKHLVEKLLFQDIGNNNVEKHYLTMK